MKFHLPGFVITSLLTSASVLGKIFAPLQIDSNRVERIKNIAYGSGPFRRLDVYSPKNRKPETNLPVSILVHGGGFRYFSKESHALAAARLALTGRVVFTIDYRLAPKDPFPAGLYDVILAYQWITENAPRFGGDLEKISLVGESAGAGLIASLCLYLYEIRRFDSDISLPPIPNAKPRAAVLHCGFFESEDVERFREDPRVYPIVQTRIRQIRDQYVPDSLKARSDLDLANPIRAYRALAESNSGLPAGFPSLFVPVGAVDPVCADSENLAASLAHLGQVDRLKVYPDEGHAFYMKKMGGQITEFWKDIGQFLDKNGA